MAVVRISNVEQGMRDLELTARVVDVGPARRVKTKFGPSYVATAILRDDSGMIRLNLWRGQISLVKSGDTVKVEGAYATVFQGYKELNVGKTGKISVVQEG